MSHETYRVFLSRDLLSDLEMQGDCVSPQLNRDGATSAS